MKFLNEKGLAQASAEIVARARAKRIVKLHGSAVIYDATCGMGADSLALADANRTVDARLKLIAGDHDHENAVFARANLEVAGADAQVIRTDALSGSVHADLLLIDPDRRSRGRRTLDPEHWSPSLSRSLETAARFAGACLKLAPALSPEDLLAAEQNHLPAELPRTREWVSNRGELAEVCLWTGTLAARGAESGASGERRATRLDGASGSISCSGVPRRVEALAPDEAARIQWLADPDPALLRAGLLGNLAEDLGLAPLASQIAYLGGPIEPKSPFLRTWRVLASEPLDPKRVRRMLTEHDIGPIQVRKRGHPDSPEFLEKRLRGRGSQRGELVVVRLERGHRAYLVERSWGPSQAGLVGDEGFEPPTSSL